MKSFCQKRPQVIFDKIKRRRLTSAACATINLIPAMCVNVIKGLPLYSYNTEIRIF